VTRERTESSSIDLVALRYHESASRGAQNEADTITSGTPGPFATSTPVTMNANPGGI